MDPIATNYDVLAETEDGSCLYSCNDPFSTNFGILTSTPSCQYEGDVIFYEDVDAAIYFDNLGIDYLDVYVGIEYIGTLQANLGFTYVPSCFPPDPDVVQFTLLWENSIQSSFLWQVRDGSGTIHYEGEDVVLANNCLPITLTYKKIQDYQNKTK